MKRSDKDRGFIVQARHWITERTFGWLNRERRLSKDYERKVDGMNEGPYDAQVFGQSLQTIPETTWYFQTHQTRAHMKTLKSFIVFSLLGVVSLAGCGGVNGAGEEDTLGATEQAACETPTPPIAGCTLIGPVDCSAGGNHYTYLCQTQPYGCKLFRDSDCTWSGHTDANCNTFQANFCN